jgi:hypothetical protein
MKHILLSLAGFVTLLILMITLIAAPVESTVPAVTLGISAAVQTQAQPAAETFMGTILKSGENFVLSDSATKTRFTLDNPRMAMPFEGSAVKVIGTLDVANGLIHVQDIQNIA